MSMNVECLRKHLQAFEFHKLFITELGWDNANSPLTVRVDEHEYTLQSVAQKRGLVAFLYQTPARQVFPDYATRRMIDSQVRKVFHEHLIIFTDSGNTQQKWQWVRREPGKPSAGREIGFMQGQTGEALIQRLQSLAFGLEEEADLTIIDVTSRVRAGFDVERVTKRFYEFFKAEQVAFLKFLQGIPDQELQRWYVSVTLNRLMFVYFIQWKGFLDGDQNYLRRHLELTRQQMGEDHFYHDFLCPLFFEGFAKKEHTQPVQTLLGIVPYLNGGIFQRHQLEERFGQAIQIPDAAFTRLFDFFDAYNWRLDERPLRADNEINPDVLGFIFEKYINQKQMGAYYTKEDITGYISKYTILPSLFERARKDCKIAFEGESSVWNHLAADPDRYIYPAMRKGMDLALPDAVSIGISDVARRGEWNRPAWDAYALHTEIWRETIARRQRSEEVRAYLASGKISDINDLITYNLDIQQFAQDVIEWSEGPELVRAFWKSLTGIKILDPTCGSGAFLFAALNILEPLYEACLDRMQTFVDELDASAARGEKHSPEKYADFRRILGQMAHHPNRSYFIYKSIIVQNLYGVDIMEEAVEICKLRLFLKLIAQVANVQDVEPLPDIDFNVRAGNTLIGFVNREDVREALTSHGQQGVLDLFGENETAKRVEEQAELADKAFQRFRQMQTDEVMNLDSFASAKAELRNKLNVLNDQLNQALALRYLPAPFNGEAYANWLKSYQPFHWFVDFYGIMSSGGFDVIIGNPPYVVYNASKVVYECRKSDYSTFNCGNLYAYVFERSVDLARKNSPISLIIQLTVLSSEKMKDLQDLLTKRGQLYAVSFPRRPVSVFDGVEMPVAILISVSNRECEYKFSSTRVQHFYAEERPTAFQQFIFVSHNFRVNNHRIAKIGLPIERSILTKLQNSKLSLELITSRASDNLVYYQEACRYWVKAVYGLPYFKRNGECISPPHGRYIFFTNPEACAFAVCLMNSSLFYWFYCTFSDGEHLNDNLVRGFKLPEKWKAFDWTKPCDNLMYQLNQSAQRKTIRTQQGHIIEYDEVKAFKAKQAIDEIDKTLGFLFGFDKSEIDFVINFEIKYRLGSDLDENKEE
jgi:hypothetical protein